MAQPSVAQFFNTRKRSAIDDVFAAKARKVLIVDKKSSELGEPCIVPVWNAKPVEKTNEPAKSTKLTARRKINLGGKQQKTLDCFMKNSETEKALAPEQTEEKTVTDASKENSLSAPKQAPVAPKKAELNLEAVKQKLTRSEKLAELKASLFRHKQADAKLKAAEAKTQACLEPKNIEVKKLKTFKSIELEVNLSPQKIQSPEKCYLSPKRDVTARKILFSPVKDASSARRSLADALEKPGLSLPYKYRFIAEVFRSVDTVCQIMHNRHEAITFTKLKPAVEEMLKRNFYEKHLAQIKTIYPEAFAFKLEKLRVYGVGAKKEQWELVIVPQVEGGITAESLLLRRKQMHNNLIHKVKIYHQEFLKSLTPPINIPLEKITKWHPEFNLEIVPDIEQFNLPKPVEEKIVTGKEVLEKAKVFLGVNRRLDSALERLKTDSDSIKPEVKTEEENTILKGIPKGLLEKVRQRQAAKALESMTRSTEKEKEYEIYSRLPELVRYTRNVFVTEKKSVLPLDNVLSKLANSYTRPVQAQELESHLKILAKDFPHLLVIVNIRNITYLKLIKNVDLNDIMQELDKKIKERSC